MRKTTSGFTIVELLIVIVVIAILAAISIVAYTGVQQQARLGVARADLRNLSQAMELFRSEHDRYPRLFSPQSTAPQTELETVLRQAGLYNTTRLTQDDLANGVYPPKRFAFCFPPGEPDRYAIVFDHPLLSDSLTNDIGKTTVYINQSGTPNDMIIGSAGTTVQGRLCMQATGATSWDQAYSSWSNAIPLKWAS